MRLSDIQPQYFPRLHYFARMLASDVFVFRDDVQFVRGHKFPDGTRGVSHQAHTPIKAQDGARLLALSVEKGSYLPINRTPVCYEQLWFKKHANTLKNLYRKAPNARALLPEIEGLLSRRFANLAELNIATVCWGLGHLLGEAKVDPDTIGIDRVSELLAEGRSTRLQRIVLGSEYFGPGTADGTSNATERIVAMCRNAGADEYLCGKTASEAYLDADLLRASGIQVTIQDWRCPPYPQQYRDTAGFVTGLSIIDLLMNVPFDVAAGILTGADQASAGSAQIGPRPALPLC